MSGDLLLSDHQIRLLCLSVGLATLLLNTFCLFLIVKHRRTFAHNIFVITACLQTLYLLLNLHFNIALIPLIFAAYGGGYCIGWLCISRIVPFWVLFDVYIFLIVNISGLFILLLFYRHQTLMHAGSSFSLSSKSGSFVSVFLMVGINVVPVIYGVANLGHQQSDLSSLLSEICVSCDWVERDRNFGVLNTRTAQINAAIVFSTIVIYGIFAFACGGHIGYVLRQHIRKSSLQSVTVTVTQTQQSLIQIVIFGIFLAIPILLFILPVFFKILEKWVLLPEIFLFSLNSFVHSCTLISTTPPYRKYLLKRSQAARTISRAQLSRIL